MSKGVYSKKKKKKKKKKKNVLDLLMIIVVYQKLSGISICMMNINKNWIGNWTSIDFVMVIRSACAFNP